MFNITVIKVIYFIITCLQATSSHFSTQPLFTVNTKLCLYFVVEKCIVILVQELDLFAAGRFEESEPQAEQPVVRTRC